MSSILHTPGAPYELPEQELSDEHTLLHDENSEETLIASLKRRFGERAWRLPLGIFMASLVVFSLLSFNRATKQSADTHFVYLAQTYNAMIRSNFDAEVAERRKDKLPFELDRRPPHRNDWASYWDITLKDGERIKGIWMDRHGHGKFRRLDKKTMVISRQNIDHKKTKQRFFISFPPGPSWLMMPLTWIWGYAVNDVLFTIFFASLNVMLMFLFLERLSKGGRSGRSRSDNAWLTLLFAAGTCHLWLAIMGQVWFTALIVGVCFTLLYMMFSIDAKHPLLAGICMAMAFSTRTPLLFTSIFFFLFVFFPGGKRLTREQWGWAFKKLVWFCIPCLIVGISLLVMNKVRFESFTEFGHIYLAQGQLTRIKKFGLFHGVFLSKNLTAMLTLLPRFTFQAPYVLISKHGMSLLFTTPALLYLLWPKPRENRADVFWHRALWLTIIACALPGLFYQNTGYSQFGFRFSLDYTPYLITLLAIGRRPIDWKFKLLILFGIFVNLFGAITFKRFPQFYKEAFFV